MHTLLERKVRPSDLYSPETAGKLDRSSLGCGLLGFGVLPGCLFWMVGRKIGEAFSEQVSRTLQVSGWALGALLFAGLMYLSWRQRVDYRAFVKSGNVQEVDVREAKWVELETVNSDPILVVDIGLGKLLILHGQWLWNPEVYGSPPLQEDPTEDTFNGLSGHLAFPSSGFTLIRRPDTGEVLAIRPSGEYLPAESFDPAGEFPPPVSESQLVEGSLADLSSVLNPA